MDYLSGNGTSLFTDLTSKKLSVLWFEFEVRGSNKDLRAILGESQMKSLRPRLAETTLRPQNFIARLPATRLSDTSSNIHSPQILLNIEQKTPRASRNQPCTCITANKESETMFLTTHPCPL